jgi:trk system potassium uptake protein TrkH
MSGYNSQAQAFLDSFFQVSSLISTTGFVSANYELWPPFSQMILIILMFFGASASSTAGGIKLSRILLAFKEFLRGIKKALNPRVVTSVKMDGHVVDASILRNVMVYIGAYFIILFSSAILISLDNFDLTSTLTASFATLSNVGHGMGMVSHSGNFSAFSNLSKIVMCFNMFAGRLEIFPLVLLWPATWKR